MGRSTASMDTDAHPPAEALQEGDFMVGAALVASPHPGPSLGQRLLGADAQAEPEVSPRTRGQGVLCAPVGEPRVARGLCANKDFRLVAAWSR